MNKPLPILLAACLLAACGQTGALYLPDEGVTTPVEIRPAPAPETPAPEGTQPAEEDEEGGQPAGNKPPGSGG